MKLDQGIKIKKISNSLHDSITSMKTIKPQNDLDKYCAADLLAEEMDSDVYFKEAALNNSLATVVFEYFSIVPSSSAM